MKHKPFDDDDLFAPDPPTVEPAWVRSGPIARLTSRSASAMIEDAMLAAVKDRCEAQLTKTALEHLGVLSAMEAQLSASTPQSAVRYQKIVDAYTIGAIRRLIEGGDDFGY